MCLVRPAIAAAALALTCVAAQAQTIKIGLVTARSGVFALFGTSAEKGEMLAADELKGVAPVVATLEPGEALAGHGRLGAVAQGPVELLDRHLRAAVRVRFAAVPSTGRKRPKLCERGNCVNRVCLSDSGICPPESTPNSITVPNQHVNDFKSALLDKFEPMAKLSLAGRAVAGSALLHRQMLSGCFGACVATGGWL